MTDLKSQKTMAAKIMKCGLSKVWIDPSRISDIADAITSADIRRMIKSGMIKKEQKTGVVETPNAKSDACGHGESLFNWTF